MILTGTPSGVGPLSEGDNVSCSLSTKEGGILDMLEFKAVNRVGGYLFVPEA